MNALYDAYRDASHWRLTGWLLVVAFVVFALVVNKVASTVFSIFVLAGLWLLVRRRHVAIDAMTRWVLLAFAAYFLVGVLSFFLGEQTRLGEKLLGRDIRFLGAAVACTALLTIAIPQHLLRRSFVAAGIVTGLVALAEILLAGDADYRAGGRTISIVFGHLAAGLFAVNLGIALFERRGRALSAGGALFALLAVILSGTRGALVSVAVVTLFAVLRVLFARQRSVCGGRLLAAAFAAVLLAVAAVAWIMPRVQLGHAQFVAHQNAMTMLARTGSEARGCLARAEVLTNLMQHAKSGKGIRAELIELPQPLSPTCGGTAAIHLSNESEGKASWLSPYRSVPVGAAGRLLVRGTAIMWLQDSDASVAVNADKVHALDIPPTTAVDASRIRIQLQPGEELVFAPVELLAGEYAFAGTDSSIGNRLDMWSGTLRQLDFSLLGQGTGSWPLAIAREAEAGRAGWRLAGYDHAHSDYLTVLLERGWLGLATLFAVLAAPWVWAAQRPLEWRSAALRLLVISTAVSALTETVFNHSISITYYCFLVLLLMTASQSGTPDKGP